MSSPTVRHRRVWTRVLVTLLGALELAIAVSAGPLVTLLVGVVSAVLLVVVPWLPRRLSRATLAVLLVVASVPFALLTWWTVVTPLLAVVALAIGLPLVLSRPTTGTVRPDRATPVRVGTP